MLHPLWRNEKQVYDEWQREQFEGYIQRWAGGDVEVLTRLEDDLLAFRNHAGDFSKVTARLRETQLQPVSWWEKYGVATPTLVSETKRDIIHFSIYYFSLLHCLYIHKY